MMQPVDSTEVNVNHIYTLIMIRIEIKYYIHNNFRKTHLILLSSYEVFIFVFFRGRTQMNTSQIKILPTFLLQDP